MTDQDDATIAQDRDDHDRLGDLDHVVLLLGTIVEAQDVTAQADPVGVVDAIGAQNLERLECGGIGRKAGHGWLGPVRNQARARASRLAFPPDSLGV